MALITGTRPQFLKMSPLIIECINQDVDFYHINSGQHYDDNLSTSLIDDIGIPRPDVNLEVGSMSHPKQIAKMMCSFESVFDDLDIGKCMVIGDTNSTLAAALVARKMGIMVYHIESGMRSFDLEMPEEQNRILVDHISDVLFTSNSGVKNLQNEGIDMDKCHDLGDITVDLLDLIVDAGVKKDKEYFVLTFHRAGNMDRLFDLYSILLNIDVDIIFPIHPRTLKYLKQKQLWSDFEDLSNVKIVKPMVYSDFIQLLSGSIGILTDSGGIQKEAFILDVPCITLRESTEWVESVDLGANRLIPCTDVRAVLSSVDDILNGRFVVPGGHPYGDLGVSKRIMEVVLDD